MDFKFEHPKKRLGQNFLWDRNIAKKIVEALNPNDYDLVVEIGPGRGILTELLINYDINYLGIEIDYSLASYLQKKIAQQNLKNFQILNMDFLKFNEKKYTSNNKKIKLLGNIPYYLTSSIIFKILDNRRFYSCCVLMLQKEVAERLVSPPGRKTYGLLSVLVQMYARVERLFNVSPNCFFPKPKVDSSVIKIELIENSKFDDNYEFYKEIIKRAFTQRRKILLNSLFKHYGINTEVLNETLINRLVKVRPEQLTPQEFVMIGDFLITWITQDERKYNR